MLPPLPGLEPTAKPNPMPTSGPFSVAAIKNTVAAAKPSAITPPTSLPPLPGIAASSVPFSKETESKPSINPAELAAAIPQAAARAGASAALEVAKPLGELASKAQSLGAAHDVPNYFENTPGAFTPDNMAPDWEKNLQSALFGQSPTESYSTRAEGIAKNIKASQPDVRAPYLLGFAGALSADALNFLGGEGESENIISNLAKETNLNKIVNDLINRGYSLDVARSVAPEIAGTTSTHAVEDILNHATEIQKTGVMKPFVAKAAEGAGSAAEEAAAKAFQFPTDVMPIKNLNDLKARLLAAKSENDAVALLREAGYSPGVARRYAEDFVRATKASEVRTALSEANYEALMEHEAAVRQGTTEARQYFESYKPPESYPEEFKAASPRFEQGKQAFEAGVSNNEVPTVQTDQFAQARAVAKTAVSDLKKGGFGNFAGDLQSAFQDWVNERRASKLAGFFKSQEFANLDKEGLAGIFEFQKKRAELSTEMESLKDYFNTAFQKLKDAGFKLGYKENYLPQLWTNSEQEVESVMRKLGLKPSFTMESVIENYEKGIQAGLTPRFTKLSDLAGWYEARLQKALGDRKFFDFLAKNDLIQPATQSPLGWKTLDPDHFPFDRVKFGDTEYTGVLKAPPELARVINNYLRQPEGFWANVARFTTAVKNIVLTSGIPETGINAHGLNILARTTLASENPIGGFLKGSYYILNPGAAEAYLLKNSENALFMVQHGLTISTEEHALDVATESAAKNALNKFRNFQGKHFEEPLFNKIIPALKVERANVIFQDLAKYYPQDEAAKIASQITNNIFGGINWEQFGRSREVQNTLRSIFLAPDWAESNLRLGGNVGKSLFQLNNPAGRAYRIFARNLMLAYTAANVTNKTLSGHWMWENDAGHTFEIQVGETGDGKKRYFKPFGTAVDFVRIPYDVALSLAKGDLSSVGRVIRNRLSAPLSAGAGFVFNTDPFGNPIFGKDKYGKPIPVEQQIGGALSLGAGLGVPQYGQALIDLATGRIGGEQALSQGLELPFRYVKPPKLKSSSTGSLPGLKSSGSALLRGSRLPSLPGL